MILETMKKICISHLVCSFCPVFGVLLDFYIFYTLKELKLKFEVQLYSKLVYIMPVKENVNNETSFEELFVCLSC